MQVGKLGVAGQRPVLGGAGSATQHHGFDNFDSASDQIMQLKEDLSHRLTLDGLDLGERYCEGDLNVLVRVKFQDTWITYVFAAFPPNLPLGNSAGDFVKWTHRW